MIFSFPYMEKRTHETTCVEPNHTTETIMYVSVMVFHGNRFFDLEICMTYSNAKCLIPMPRVQWGHQWKYSQVLSAYVCAGFRLLTLTR